MRSWPCFCSSLPPPPSLLRLESTAVSTSRKPLDGTIDSHYSPGYVRLQYRGRLHKTKSFELTMSIGMPYCLYCIVPYGYLPRHWAA